MLAFPGAVRAAAFAALCAAGFVQPAAAQTVALQGMMGNRALLIVNGHAPKMVAPGETFEGIKVLSTTSQEAVVEIGGQRHTLRVGDGPASVGGSGAPQAGTGSKVVLTAGSGGHFYSEGFINGKPVNFIVDTGATFVALSVREAQRTGIDFRGKGMPGRIATANGDAPAWRVKLDSVRVGDVQLFGVDAVVVQSDLSYVLLGNSFLSRFQITQGGGNMVLERRY